MALRHWWEGAEVLSSRVAMRWLRVTRGEWLEVAGDAAAARGQLLALWSSAEPLPAIAPAIIRAALRIEAGVLLLELPFSSTDMSYPGLQMVFPAAARMQRAAFDLSGVRSDDPDQRSWLRHAAWPEDWFPLASRTAYLPDSAAADRYLFTRVEGDGVHEIPVGPVHAGIIEPGHFRFSVVGEKVMRLEERLGYVHKGIERRFSELLILEGHRLAARVCGDSTVAFSFAYCQALEDLSGCTVPDRGLWLRALCLEIERIQNHIGDVAALGNDAGFAFGYAQFSRVKEEFLRAVERTLGQRYLFDIVVPGGTAVDVTAASAAELSHFVLRMSAEVRELREIYDQHEGVRDRFIGTGAVLPDLAQRLGLVGLAGRASNQDFDARADLPCPPYDILAPLKVVRSEGDVAARVAVRFEELQESCRLVRRILSELPSGAHRAEIAAPPEGGFAVGLVEGWRGPVLVALESGAHGTIRRCHAHDPSWQNWPVIEHAVLDNIVPDFPLINKSFNLSYSGHDL
jgi:Ni,Fe-hydrogenase III large subunit